MYNLQQLNVLQIGKLPNVPIPKQADITAQTGKPMDLMKIYQAIVTQSNNFTEKDTDALSADALMWQYLKNQGFFKTDGIEQKTLGRKKDTSVVPIQELGSDPKKSLSDAIEGLQTLLDLEDNALKQASLKEAIEGLEVLFEL